MNFFDMLFEYQEDKEIERIKSKTEEIENFGGGEKLSKEEIDEAYNDLDLKQFDKNV